MLSSAAMRAVCDDAAYLQNMLDFEAALARAEAAAGVIPASAAGPIAKACKAEAFDLAALAEAATRSGNLAIPLVKALTANVAKADADAARYVHWGATSQDVIDTATMLTLRAGIDALLGDIDRAIAGFAKLARQHRDTAMVARTWLQHALPMPFGLKLAEYAAALHRSRARLKRLRSEALALQFGGAAGTLAALGDKGLLVAEKLAQELKLPLPDAPWHTHRDRIAEAASVFAILAGTCGKIARDVSLMMQTDVAEAFEPSGEGRGGSSTMPHKRNPVAAASALAAATMAPNLAATIFAAQVRDHERSAGPWHAEWPTLPTLLLVTSGRACRHRRHRRRTGSRRRAHARQSRRDRRADHGGSGDDGAGGKDRQERRASSDRGRQQEGRRREKASARRADRGRKGHRASRRGKTCKTVRADGLSGRLASPDRPLLAHSCLAGLDPAIHSEDLMIADQVRA